MKILSLNLHCFKEENRFEKLDKIAAFIIEKDIDVCIFQEVAQLTTESSILGNIKPSNNAYYIAEKIGYNVEFHPIKIGFEILEEGLAFLSKTAITNIYYKTISKETDFTKWYKRDYFAVDIAGITFVNVHLGWDACGEKGQAQIDCLLNDILELDNLVFVGGDFNYPDNSNEIKSVKKHLFSISDLDNVDSYSNPTFHFSLDNSLLESDNRMIDFIFTNQKILIKKFEIAFDEDYVSDHSGIYFEF